MTIRTSMPVAALAGRSRPRAGAFLRVPSTAQLLLVSSMQQQQPAVFVYATTTQINYHAFPLSQGKVTFDNQSTTRFARSFSTQPHFHIDENEEGMEAYTEEEDAATTKIESLEEIKPPTPAENIETFENPTVLGISQILSDLPELLLQLKQIEEARTTGEAGVLEQAKFCQNASDKFECVLSSLSQNDNLEELDPSILRQLQDLLSAANVDLAIEALTHCGYKPQELSQKVRAWEKHMGKLRWTPLTDNLSLRLLIANAQSGNVGRVLALLNLRKARDHQACEEEFIFAIQSLKTSSLSQHLGGIRNIFVHESNQSAIDNPTRWLDAILLNMSQRQFPLTTSLANRMISCYSATGGRTGKGVHHFYKVTRQGILNMPPEDRPENTDAMPKDWVYVPKTGETVLQPVKVRVKYVTTTPPYYKVPSAVKGKKIYNPQSNARQLKLQREVEPEYSLSLASAFAFTDSLQQGACEHKPISLDASSYNALIKSCVRRGALWRAMRVLDKTMPSAGIEPNSESYNFLLSGLAGVGDVVTAEEYYLQMYNNGIKPDQYTVKAIVDGLLNVNDIPGAITAVQDFFNQHSVLPPMSTQMKILELSLGSGLVYEAKRYVFFIQQLWKWEPNQYHNEDFLELMQATQADPQLQKEALVKLFAYFGEELRDSDFLP